MNTILKASAAVAALLVLSSGAANATVCFLTGTSGDDTLTATPSMPPCDYVISGLAGDDTLTGGGGSDRLSPGSQSLVHSGHDTMTGNGGVDFFFIDDTPASFGVNAQEITDFTHGTDKIVVAPVCAAHSVTCTFIGGSAFSGTAGEVRYSVTGGSGFGLLEIDLDGGGTSDFDVKLDGAPTVSGSDVLTSPPPRRNGPKTTSAQ